MNSPGECHCRCDWTGCASYSRPTPPGTTSTGLIQAWPGLLPTSATSASAPPTAGRDWSRDRDGHENPGVPTRTCQSAASLVLYSSFPSASMRARRTCPSFSSSTSRKPRGHGAGKADQRSAPTPANASFQVVQLAIRVPKSPNQGINARTLPEQESLDHNTNSRCSNRPSGRNR